LNAADHPLVAPVLAGDRRAVARAISAIENGAPEAAPIETGIAARRGRAHVVGITGAPGAGKSTLIHALLGEYIRRGQRVAVVAVDPSSPVTGGAVLGDRVRMGEHGAHPDVFIRSIASRGHLGGLARTTGRIVDLLDAAGFDTVIVETVGTGQSEVEIARLADTRVVVSAPGLGDDVQAIKAGILEIADVLAVSKGDLPTAEATVRDLKDMLALRRRGAWPVLVVRTSGTTGDGVAALLDRIIEHAGAAGRGQRLVTSDAPTVDDTAAIDRAITSRRSVRRFLSKPVPRGTVEDILAVASRAPSGTNVQPWRVRVVAGAARERLCDAIVAAHAAGENNPEFAYYPTKWFEPYLARRRKVGWDLYGLLGIGRDDKARMHAQHARNYRFFDAPVGMIFTVHRDLEEGSLIDYGMFLQSIMVAARARGLDTCPQAAWMEFPRQIAAVLGIPAEERLVCGMALGYADPDAPENRLVTEREPVPGFADFDGFD
jgi:LAO/AO transport system ATPase